jgi:hypothetical protein
MDSRDYWRLAKAIAGWTMAEDVKSINVTGV